MWMTACQLLGQSRQITKYLLLTDVRAVKHLWLTMFCCICVQRMLISKCFWCSCLSLPSSPWSQKSTTATTIDTTIADIYSMKFNIRYIYAPSRLFLVSINFTHTLEFRNRHMNNRRLFTVTCMIKFYYYRHSPSYVQESPLYEAEIPGHKWRLLKLELSFICQVQLNFSTP